MSPAILLLAVEPLGEIRLLRFILELALLLVVARGLGEIFKRIGQPPIVGELLAGIVIGPSFLASIFPGFYNAIFAPDDASQQHILEAFSWLGIILLLVVAGIETDLRIVQRVGKVAISTAVWSMVIPFVTGAALGYAVSRVSTLNENPQHSLVFTLFIAIMLSISAVPVIAKILIDLDLMRTNTGITILSAAVANDTLGWILLAAASGLAVGGVQLMSLSISVGGTVLFLVLAYFLGRPVVNALTGWAAGMNVNYRMLTISLVIAFSLAAVTQFIGVHAILGAFIAGILIGESPHVEDHTVRRLEGMVMGLFAPIFFAASGLKVDLTQLFDPLLIMVGIGVILIASIGKIVGGTLGARLGGMHFWQAAAVGSGLNARGSMEIIAATLALSLGVITQQMYSIIVVMAIVTSMMAPPLLRWTLGKYKKVLRKADGA